VTTIAPPPPAPPAPATSPSLPPGRRVVVRGIIVVAASILVLGYVAALGVAAGRLNAVRLSVETKDLPAGMRSLTIEAADADVRISVDPKADAPRVDLRTVDSTTDDDHERMEVTSVGADTRLLLTPGAPSFMDWGRMGSVTVTLSPQLASRLSVIVRQDDGTLTVDADLGQLTAYTADGDIALNAGARRVDLTSRDGDVVAPKPISVAESFVAHTADGDIRVEFKGVTPRTVEASSRDGDIAIALPGPGPYLVDASADSRRIRVPETTDPGKATAEVTVRTVDGDVAVDTSGAAR
jgi:putative adhesin